jgi:hypothetical protein
MGTGRWKAPRTGSLERLPYSCARMSSDSKMNLRSPSHFGHLNMGTVETSETIQCPFCGQSFDVVIDTSIAQQRFTTDCEVCCRPLEISVECEPGEVLSLEIH